jgi:protein-S-isoprenylcysteine O-methyltransferase Ste14
MFLAGMLMFSWAMMSNSYFSTTVRIQDDRGHQTVTSGPYQYVRHPGYVGAIVLSIGTPLLLRSWWVLSPGVVTAIMFIPRTAMEDRTLQQELGGYAEYAERVRYRLLPGVW